MDLSERVRAALDEDRASGDVTTLATVPADAQGAAVLVAHQAGVIAGLECVALAFEALDAGCVIDRVVPDGTHVLSGASVMHVAGRTRALLSAERVALNFGQRLSGIATLTSIYVETVRGLPVRILDTRKTTPGWRDLEKYAVRMGGGANHRMDLASMALVKDNHLAFVGGDVALAVKRVRALLPPGAEIEVEADTLAQVEAAIACGVERILLDNMALDELRAAVALVAGRARLEASGGVTLETVRAIAETGVNDISVGALTHSAPAFDLGLDLTEPR